jgi:GTP-sensing pleiotropic transcriptional regulator CodY
MSEESAEERMSELENLPNEETITVGDIIDTVTQIEKEKAVTHVQEESKLFRASFVSTISKFSAKNARLGIAIPAKIRSQFPVGITVAVTVTEIKEGQVQQ